MATDQPFTIMDGPPPIAAKGQRNDPLKTAISALKPGQHIVVKPDKIKKATLASKICAVKKNGIKARMYTAFSGDFIVLVDK